MKMENADSTVENVEPKLPRKDWILLPMIGIMTIAALVGGTNLVAARKYKKSPTSIDDCLNFSDATTGVRGIPNTVCHDKGRDTQLTEYRFDSRGFRTSVVHDRGSASEYRIAMLGSSVALGQWVQGEKTFASLLPIELSSRTGKKVELYNEAMISEHPQVVGLRVQDALSTHPDIILWVVTPYDIGIVLADPDSMLGGGGTHAARLFYQIKYSFTHNSLLETTRFIWSEATKRLLDSPTGAMLQEVIFQDRSRYVSAYLKKDDSQAGFLRSDLSPKWQQCLQRFAEYADKLQKRSGSAGVPLVVVLVPQRAQVAMISSGEWPSGSDPYLLDSRLNTIIRKAGGIYVDILPDFRTIPNPELNYFPLNGHPDSDGHAIISHILAKKLTSGIIPGLSPNR